MPVFHFTVTDKRALRDIGKLVERAVRDISATEGVARPTTLQGLVLAYSDGAGVMRPVTVTTQLPVTATLAAGAATIGKVDQGAAGAAAWPVVQTGALPALSAGTAVIGYAYAIPYSASRSDDYTGVATGTPVTLSYPCQSFALQCKGVGGLPTIWDIRLEGSLNGTDYTQLVQHTNATGDGVTVWTADKPVLYVQSRSAGAITLGTASAIRATIMART